MDERNFTLDEIKESLDEFLGQASDAAAPALERFAELQEQRAARLGSARERLKAGLGEDHPQVTALGEAAALADRLRSSLRATSVRESHRPKVGPHEWVVFGRV